MSQQKYPKAYEAYQQAVYRDGKNPTFWCSIGVLYYQINQYRDALDAYSRAIRLNPYISEVWYDLGTLVSSLLTFLHMHANQYSSTRAATTRSQMLWTPTSVLLNSTLATPTSRLVFNFSDLAEQTADPLRLLLSPPMYTHKRTRPMAQLVLSGEDLLSNLQLQDLRRRPREPETAGQEDCPTSTLPHSHPTPMRLGVSHSVEDLRHLCSNTASLVLSKSSKCDSLTMTPAEVPLAEDKRRHLRATNTRNLHLNLKHHLPSPNAVLPTLTGEERHHLHLLPLQAMPTDPTLPMAWLLSVILTALVPTAALFTITECLRPSRRILNIRRRPLFTPSTPRCLPKVALRVYLLGPDRRDLLDLLGLLL